MIEHKRQRESINFSGTKSIRMFVEQLGLQIDFLLIRFMLLYLKLAIFF